MLEAITIGIVVVVVFKVSKSKVESDELEFEMSVAIPGNNFAHHLVVTGMKNIVVKP
jgi:hypothetical protein